jgi:NitT/TauT family transport system substrate-binding protein
LFPPSEAALITDLIRRDLPYYDPTLSQDFVAGMSAFARKQNILDSDLAYEDVVATQFSSLWKA